MIDPGMAAQIFESAMGRLVLDLREELGSAFAVVRPPVYPDGDQWCALYGADLQVGVAGFGDTPDQAVRAFNRAWVLDPPPGVAA